MLHAQVPVVEILEVRIRSYDAVLHRNTEEEEWRSRSVISTQALIRRCTTSELGERHRHNTIACSQLLDVALECRHGVGDELQQECMSANR